MNIVTVHPDRLDEYWQDMVSILHPVFALEYQESTLDGVKNRLIQGEELALVILDDNKMIGVCILGVSSYESGGKALEVPYLAGTRMDDWLAPGFEVVENIARNMGCDRIRGGGRKGWLRLLPKFKPIRTIFEAKL